MGGACFHADEASGLIIKKKKIIIITSIHRLLYIRLRFRGTENFAMIYKV